MSDLNLTSDDALLIRRVIDGLDSDLPDELYSRLFDHYCNNGEIPYGVAKARTGDPYEWIYGHMHELLV